MTALGAALLPTAGFAESAADDSPEAAPASEQQSEFERYLTGAAAAQCEGARQMCGASKESSDE